MRTNAPEHNPALLYIFLYSSRYVMNGMACPPNTLYLCVQDAQSDYVATQLSDHGLWGKFNVVYIYSVAFKNGSYIPMNEHDVPISVPPVVVGTPSYLFFVNNQANIRKGTKAILTHFKIIQDTADSNGGGETSKPMSLLSSGGEIDGASTKPVRFPTTPVVIHDNPSAINASYTPIVPGVTYTKNAIDAIQQPTHTGLPAPSTSGMLIASASELKKNDIALRMQEYNEKIERPLTYGN